MTDRELLTKIVFRLEGMNLDQMTVAERQIAELLTNHGLAYFDNTGDFYRALTQKEVNR
jgi:hypothetical protein